MITGYSNNTLGSRYRAARERDRQIIGPNCSLTYSSLFDRFWALIERFSPALLRVRHDDETPVYVCTCNNITCSSSLLIQSRSNPF